MSFTESGTTIDGYSLETEWTGFTVVNGENTLNTAKAAPEGQIVNTYTRDTGSLKLKKTVSVNGQTTNIDTTLVDGEYTFHIQSVDVTPATDKYIKVTIDGGVATAAEFIAHTETDKTPASLTLALDNSSKETVLTGLPTGQYNITEILTEAQTAAGISQLVKPETTIEIEKDQEGVTVKTAAFQNNREVGDLEISKEVTGTTDNTKDFKFTVTLTFPAGITIADTYPAETTISVSSNPLNKYTDDTEEHNILVNNSIRLLPGTSEQERTVTLYLKAEESVLIKNLPAGTTYTVAEDSTVIPAGYKNTNPSGGTYSGSIGRTRSVAAFENDYTLLTTSVAFGGVKTIEGTDRTNTKFYFELHETDDTYATSEQTLIETVNTNGTLYANNENGYGFRAITYTELGNHYYVIKEKTIENDG